MIAHTGETVTQPRLNLEDFGVAIRRQEGIFVLQTVTPVQGGWFERHEKEWFDELRLRADDMVFAGAAKRPSPIAGTSIMNPNNMANILGLPEVGNVSSMSMSLPSTTWLAELFKETLEEPDASDPDFAIRATSNAEQAQLQRRLNAASENLKNMLSGKIAYVAGAYPYSWTHPKRNVDNEPTHIIAPWLGFAVTEKELDPTQCFVEPVVANRDGKPGLFPVGINLHPLFMLLDKPAR